MLRFWKGACITEPNGRRWKLGEEGLKPGEMRFREGVRYGLSPASGRTFRQHDALLEAPPRDEEGLQAQVP